MDDETRAKAPEETAEETAEDTTEIQNPTASSESANNGSDNDAKPAFSNTPKDEMVKPNKDALFKEVLTIPTYCADFLNQNLFGGKKRVTEDGITYLAKEITYISTETFKATTRRPDVPVLSVVHRDNSGSTCFLIFILESQVKVDYSMVPRLMVESGMFYLAQYEEHRMDEYRIAYRNWKNRPNN